MTEETPEIQEPYPLVEKIIALENGEMVHEEAIELFQHLVDTGLAWRLQGTYGRIAHDLIEAGLVTPPQVVT